MPAATYFENAHEEGQNRGDVNGSSELAIVVSRRSWREISLWKAGDRHTANALLTSFNASDKTLVFSPVRALLRVRESSSK
jgi:hypothetical protein